MWKNHTGGLARHLLNYAIPFPESLMSRNNSLVLSAIVTILATVFLSVASATEPNDTFAEATVLSFGTLTVSDTLEGGEPSPDTYLGFFADDTFPLPPLEEDDDSSPIGDGFADAFFGLPVNADGSIPLAVTGCCDDFDGSHGEEGDYELFVDVFDAGGLLMDSFSTTSTLFPGVIDEFPFADAAWVGGTFDVIIDNTIGFVPGDDPIDYWVFTGLTPGTEYVAEITGSDFDPILALLAADGSVIETDDDDGVGLLSLLGFLVPASGEVTLAVTGFADFDLEELHSEVGFYDLSLSIAVPEPTTVVSLIVGLATGMCYRRRNS